MAISPTVAVAAIRAGCVHLVANFLMASSDAARLCGGGACGDLLRRLREGGAFGEEAPPMLVRVSLRPARRCPRPRGARCLRPPRPLALLPPLPLLLGPSSPPGRAADLTAPPPLPAGLPACPQAQIGSHCALGGGSSAAPAQAAPIELTIGDALPSLDLGCAVATTLGPRSGTFRLLRTGPVRGAGLPGAAPSDSEASSSASSSSSGGSESGSRPLDPAPYLLCRSNGRHAATAVLAVRRAGRHGGGNGGGGQEPSSPQPPQEWLDVWVAAAEREAGLYEFEVAQGESGMHAGRGRWEQRRRRRRRRLGWVLSPAPGDALPLGPPARQPACGRGSGSEAAAV